MFDSMTAFVLNAEWKINTTKKTAISPSVRPRLPLSGVEAN